jgi:hypothetical protein
VGNEGFFELGFVDTAGNRVVDASTAVRFTRASDGRTIQQAQKLQFPPTRLFRLPAFPQEQNLFCEVAPSRYRQRTSGFFTLTDGETILRNLTLFPRPDK